MSDLEAGLQRAPRAAPRNFTRTTPEEVTRNLGTFDFAIFQRLPLEGSQLGLHPEMKSQGTLRIELNALQPPEAPEIRIGELNSRLRLLQFAGFVVAVPTLSGGIAGWQRTHAADAIMAQRQRVELQSSAEGPQSSETGEQS